MKKKNYCLDCKKLIDYRSKRCIECHSKYYKGNRSTSFKGGKPKCKDCGKEINYQSTRCQKCFNRIHNKNKKKLKGKLNPNYKHGKTSVISYCKYCGKQLCKDAYYLGYDKCRSCSSKINSKGRRNGMYGKITHGKWGIYNNIKMRSSWEIKYAKYLDKNNIKWKYEPKTFDLGDCTYRPDFYLPDTDTWIEIKGWWREDAKEKFNMFLQQYPNINIEVLYQEQLSNLGIKL